MGRPPGWYDYVHDGAPSGMLPRRGAVFVIPATGAEWVAAKKAGLRARLGCQLGMRGDRQHCDDR